MPSVRSEDCATGNIARQAGYTASAERLGTRHRRAKEPVSGAMHQLEGQSLVSPSIPLSRASPATQQHGSLKTSFTPGHPGSQHGSPTWDKFAHILTPEQQERAHRAHSARRVQLWPASQLTQGTKPRIGKQSGASIACNADAQANYATSKDALFKTGGTTRKRTAVVASLEEVAQPRSQLLRNEQPSDQAAPASRKRSAAAAGLDNKAQPSSKRARHQPASHQQQPEAAPAPPPTSASFLSHWACQYPAVTEDDFDEQFPTKLLGQGSYGTVTSGAWKHFGPGTAYPEALVAIKRPVETILPDQLPAAQQNLAHEANITASVFYHANLLKPVAILYADADKQHVAGLVYPLMEGGDVWGILNRHYGQGKSMDCYNRLAILKGIASGLESMHTAGIAHLDIKPANVMVEPECHHEAARIILDDNEVRLGDFGLCRPLAAGQQVSSRCGTQGYMAPEQVCHNLAHQKSDIFSVGMVAATLIHPDIHSVIDIGVKQCGSEQAFYTSSNEQEGALSEGLDSLIRDHLAPRCKYDSELLDVIRECWRPLPDQRPSAAELRQWLYEDYGRSAPAVAE